MKEQQEQMLREMCNNAGSKLMEGFLHLWRSAPAEVDENFSAMTQSFGMMADFLLKFVHFSLQKANYKSRKSELDTREKLMLVTNLVTYLVENVDSYIKENIVNTDNIAKEILDKFNHEHAIKM